ncbi:PAS domain S-box protein [Anaerobacillus alkaliphilus]|uniref:PAS domain S-box protein n=1 Tax=Anaerobacillus alkaliphilus TaxID=1548597 RepID=A0A4Q0VT07_9BACI|nr:sigma 54-interacting transcriptional regulator [Anaerobacillus alkaliphilus]RXJ00675.1 PAS domain S-box protein [Anaerobacillus alkaliphilus]
MNNNYSLDILSTVLDSAYEGIVVINHEGKIIHFNEAYCRFTGIKIEDALGQHVTKIIENTRLHHVLKSGIPERGSLQIINGQEMVVHRIPIRKNDQVVAVIGMLIFEGVSELYKILEKHQQKAKTRLANTETKPLITLEQIIGKSEKIADTKQLARKAAKTLATVLITGESGTGKELFAQSIHLLSPFSTGPFVSVNCAAIPDHLLESELFGYADGAFTGARKGGKPGKFELANEGTLFLDEIGDMPLAMQSKILRVLQEKEGTRVGGVKPYRTNTRIVAATNKSLEQMVMAGTFREDLYYRLNIIRLHIPPLRERKEDIPLLLAHYMEEVCQKYNISIKRLTNTALVELLSYEWPGNIRELVNIVERMISLVDKEDISASDVSLLFNQSTISQSLSIEASDLAKAPLTIFSERKKEMKLEERDLIINVLIETNGNKAKAARKLGIHRSTLYDKLKLHDITM